jgi:hypothetical protein
MASDEENEKAANLTTFELIKALIAIYGYEPVYLGPIEDIHANRLILKRLEEGKKLQEIVDESGRSLSTVRRRKEERLGIQEKDSDN